MSDLSLRSVTKVFRREHGEEVRAIDDVSLDIAQGEFIVLLGPSGCGKTTLLRSVAGLEFPTSGTITIGGVEVFDPSRGLALPPEQRQLGMVFQSYALWPHLTVADNVAYPLKMSGLRGPAVKERVGNILEMMRIGHLTRQFPGQISGGQQQRVALARALVRGDSLVLFDEPLSNVDAKVREHLRIELLSMQRELGFTALYVTHDQHEAMGLATQIAVVSSGKIAQLGTPREIYRHPKNLNVAEFVGSVNKMDGTVRTEGDVALVETAEGVIELPPAAAAELHGRDVVVISRPEDWTLSLEPQSGEMHWAGEILTCVFSGPYTEYIVMIGELRLVVWVNRGDLLPAGQKVWCRVDPDAVVLFDRA